MRVGRLGTRLGAGSHEITRYSASSDSYRLRPEARVQTGGEQGRAILAIRQLLLEGNSASLHPLKEVSSALVWSSFGDQDARRARPTRL